jgi:hypothetical protein
VLGEEGLRPVMEKRERGTWGLRFGSFFFVLPRRCFELGAVFHIRVLRAVERPLAVVILMLRTQKDIRWLSLSVSISLEESLRAIVERSFEDPNFGSVDVRYFTETLESGFVCDGDNI